MTDLRHQNFPKENSELPLIKRVNPQGGAGADQQLNQEAWFFYWKTPKSLWENKIQQLRAKGHKILLIPLYWASHHISVHEYDFGQIKQENDLKTLIQIAHGSGLETTLMIPVGPMPLMPLGGLPMSLVKGYAMTEAGYPLTVVDREGKLGKLFSFVDGKIFHAYRLFLSQLSKYLHFSEGGGGKSLFQVGLLNSHYLNLNQQIVSFTEDYSEEAKKRCAHFYIQSKSSHESNMANQKLTRIDWQNFRKEMHMLYQQLIQDNFEKYYSGEKNFLFLGVHELHPLTHITSPGKNKILDDIKFALQRGFIPSFLLLQKGDQFFSKLGMMSLLNDQFLKSAYSGEEEEGYLPLKLAQVMMEGSSLETMEEELKSFLQLILLGSWNKLEKISDILNEEELLTNLSPVIILHRLPNQEMTSLKEDQRLRHIIKVFLRGKTIVLNIDSLTDLEQSEMECFIAENKLSKMESNVISPLSCISIGDGGGLYLYSSNHLKQLPLEARKSFWNQLWKLMDQPYLNIKKSPSIQAIWLKRNALQSEMHYEEIRRLVFYHESMDQNAECTIDKTGQHALLKYQKDESVELTSTVNQLVIIFKGKGMMTLDFGVLEEGDSHYV